MKFLLILLICSFSTVAWGKPIVGSLMVQDARGRWITVNETAEAATVRGEERQTLKISDTLEYGDVITTQNARVEIIWTEGEDSEQIYIWEHAKVTITGERSVIQEIGELYYQLRDSFSIQYGTVETMVDGTAFKVSGPNPVEVGVTEGVVRVREGSEEQRVKAGQFVSVAGSGVPPAARWSGAAQRAVKTKSYMDGFAHTELGVMAAGLQLPVSGPVGAQLYGQFRLLKTFQIRTETGILQKDGLQLPQTLELSYRLGGLALGARGQANIYQENKDCPDGCEAILWGVSAAASGVARFSVPITSRLVASADISGGADFQPEKIQAFGAGRVGIGVAF